MPTDISLSKTMPHNLEAERAVLGSVLLDDKAIFIAAENLLSGDFYLEAHRIIFERMIDLMQEERSIDTVTLHQELRRHDEEEKIGGPTYLIGLTDGLPRATNIGHYAQIVREMASLRQLIQLSNESMQRCYQAEDRPSQIIESIEERIFSIAAREKNEGFQAASELTSHVYKEIEEADKQKSPVIGISTGFTALDNLTGGLHPRDLVIIAARPGLGKTALCLNTACNAAIRNKRAVGIFSLEMSKEALIKRMISAEAQIDGRRMRDGSLTGDEWQRIAQATNQINQARIFLDDSPNLTGLQLRAAAQRLKLQHGIDLLIVDYLQLLSGRNKRYETRNQEITEISRGLKNLAKELNAPVIAVSQLNREIEKRTAGRKPQLSDLRESGAIEQDADLVIFISRDEMNLVAENNSGIAEITIAKQRNGPTGGFELVFLKTFTKFENLRKEQ